MHRLAGLSYPIQDLLAVLGLPRAQNVSASAAGTRSVAFWKCGCSAEQEGRAREYAWFPCPSHGRRDRVRPAV